MFYSKHLRFLWSDWKQHFDIICYENILSHWTSLETMGLYALVTIRYVSRYKVHDTIQSTIYLLFLAGKERPTIQACDQEHHTSPATGACTVIMCSVYNNEGVVGVSSRSFFGRISCFIRICWLLSLSISWSFLIIARDRTLLYHNVISLSVSRYVLSAQIYRCTGTMMNHFTPIRNN